MSCGAQDKTVLSLDNPGKTRQDRTLLNRLQSDRKMKKIIRIPWYRLSYSVINVTWLIWHHSTKLLRDHLQHCFAKHRSLIRRITSRGTITVKIECQRIDIDEVMASSSFQHDWWQCLESKAIWNLRNLMIDTIFETVVDRFIINMNIKKLRQITLFRRSYSIMNADMAIPHHAATMPVAYAILHPYTFQSHSL